MPRVFFEKCGFFDTDEKADVSLMAVKFGEEEPPRTEREQAQEKWEPRREKGKLVIDMFDNGGCPVSFVARQLVKEAARDFGGNVIVREHDTKDKAIAEKFGSMKGIYLDGKRTFFGYPDKEYQGILAGINEALRRKLDAKR
jgi:thiol-disulfide isomerase/thioredoxin